MYKRQDLGNGKCCHIGRHIHHLAVHHILGAESGSGFIEMCIRDRPYGVAMFLAQAEGDGTNQQYYASLYQQKRNAVRRYPRRRQDVLPTVWGD